MTRSPLLSRRAFGLATATLPVVLAAPGRAQGALWSMATEYPANTVSGDAIAFFAEQLARESGGRLTVRPVTDAAMGKSAEIVGAILQGGLAAGDSFSGALGGVDPLFLLSSLPFVATTEADAARLLERARPLYAATMARHKQRLLYASPWPPSGLWAKKPIVSLADLKGLRVRVYDSTGVSVFAAAGASPANLSFADVMPRLKDGSIDAVLSSGDGGAGRRLWEFLPHFTEIGYAIPLGFGTLGTAIYDALPASLQPAVDRAAAATQAEAWRSLGRRLQANRARMTENGVTITPAEKLDEGLRRHLATAAAGAIAEWKQKVPAEAAALLAA
jgi:TRAP-type C4-dicarboxylate transport system substrate-binding protein